jgi:pyruvate ferredoxin oxidoreductase alpha subunit
MVCMDGFVLTHAFEPIEVPTREQVERYLPPFTPRQVLDPADPVTIGAMVGPEAFTEVRYLAHREHLRALDRIPALGDEFARVFDRPGASLVAPYHADADTVVVALGSVLGTVKDTVDELRASGHSVGALGVTTFRPFPFAAVRAALAGARRVIVLDRALAVGVGGVVAADVGAALTGAGQQLYTVVAGLGGRPVTRASLKTMLTSGALEPLTFLDLDTDLLAEAAKG